MRSVESLSCDFLQDMSLNLCSDYKTAVCNITLYFPQTVTKCKSHLIFTMDPRKTKNRFPFIPPTPGYPPTSIPGYNGQSSTTIPVQSQSILPPVEKDAALQLDLVPALPPPPLAPALYTPPTPIVVERNEAAAHFRLPPTPNSDESSPSRSPVGRTNGSAVSIKDPLYSKNGISATLLDAEMWNNFYNVGNEMIVTKPGR